VNLSPRPRKRLYLSTAFVRPPCSRLSLLHYLRAALRAPTFILFFEVCYVVLPSLTPASSFFTLPRNLCSCFSQVVKLDLRPVLSCAAAGPFTAPVPLILSYFIFPSSGALFISFLRSPVLYHPILLTFTPKQFPLHPPVSYSFSRSLPFPGVVEIFTTIFSLSNLIFPSFFFFRIGGLAFHSTQYPSCLRLGKAPRERFFPRIPRRNTSFTLDPGCQFPHFLLLRPSFFFFR